MSCIIGVFKAQYSCAYFNSYLTAKAQSSLNFLGIKAAISMREADHRTRESETCFCCVLVVQDRYSSYELNVIYFFNLNLRS